MRHPDSLSAAEPLPADTDGTRTAELVKALLERIHYTKEHNIPTPVEGMWTSYFCSIDADPCRVEEDPCGPPPSRNRTCPIKAYGSSVKHRCL